jgi:hypothetical protein
MLPIFFTDTAHGGVNYLHPITNSNDNNPPPPLSLPREWGWRVVAIVVGSGVEVVVGANTNANFLFDTADRGVGGCCPFFANYHHVCMHARAHVCT